MKLNEEPFSKIKDGSKTIEMRLFDEKRQIWIDRFVDTINDDMFIPRDDANG